MRFSTVAGLTAALLAMGPASALAASKTFDVEPFTAIEITSGLDAVVTVGGTLSVVAESPRQEELDELRIEVRNGRLRASTDGEDWGLLEFLFEAGNRETRITITVPELTAAEASAGSDVDVSGMSGDEVVLNASSGADLNVTAASGTRFELNASSGSDLTVEGTCKSADVNASSGSDLDAERLLCEDVAVNASSGSGARVHASASVDAEASSGASVSVSGKPAEVEQEASSGGDIDLRD